MKNRAFIASFDEEYYPISQEILASFPKFRPSVDLFIFEETIGQLYPLAVKGQRLTDKKIEDIVKACEEGVLFVSRSDHHIYIEHLAKQADFVLIDPNLKELEIRQILTQAISVRLQALFDQPLAVVYAHLYKDLMVFVEYLYRDKDRINPFMADLHIGEDEIVTHSFNVLIIGIWLYFQTEKKMDRKTFERIVQGLILHDLGCAKIPVFILKKKTPLTRDELVKYHSHPTIGVQLVQKFGYTFDEINQVILQHHERLDGSGFPNRLSSSGIKEFGLLAGVADTFAAMITNRSVAYRKKTLDAAQALFKDTRFSAKYTGVLMRAYNDETFENV